MATVVLKFKEAENVLFLIPFNHAGAGIVPLKFPTNNPFTNKKEELVYRNTSLRGKQIYYYRPSTTAGEARGG